MTQFEFVTVAISLLYASSLSDAIRSGVSAYRSANKHLPYLLWLILIVLIIFFAWHATWNSRVVTWSGGLFLYTMLVPVLTAIAARLLTQRDSGVSQKAHYEEVRTALFTTILFLSIVGGIASWVQGITPWGEFAPAQMGAAPGTVFGIAGLLDKNGRRDSVYIALMATILVVAILFLPTRGVS